MGSNVSVKISRKANMKLHLCFFCYSFSLFLMWNVLMVLLRSYFTDYCLMDSSDLLAGFFGSFYSRGIVASASGASEGIAISTTFLV